MSRGGTLFRGAICSVTMLLGLAHATVAEGVPDGTTLPVAPNSVRWLHAISEAHGLVFLATSDADILFDVKQNKAIPFKTLWPKAAEGRQYRIRAVSLSPNGRYALCCLADRSKLLVLDLKKRSVTEIEVGGQLLDPMMTLWWGDRIVLLSIPDRKIGMCPPLRIIDIHGQPVEFPKYFAVPVAASPDGKQLVVVTTEQDLAKPFDLRMLERADAYDVVRVDANGKELERLTNRKHHMRRTLPPFGRISFDPTGRYLLTGLLDEATTQKMKDAANAGDMAQIEGPARMLDTKTGKTSEIKVMATGPVVALDGMRVLSATQTFSALDGPMLQYKVCDAGSQKPIPPGKSIPQVRSGLSDRRNLYWMPADSAVLKRTALTDKTDKK